MVRLPAQSGTGGAAKFGRWLSAIASGVDRFLRIFTGDRRYWLTATLSMAMILALTLSVRFGATSQFDRAVILWASGHRSAAAIALFEGVTFATRWQSYAMACFTGATLFAVLGYRRRSVALTMAAVASGFGLGILQFFMSELAHQVRPVDFDGSHSFPSGHSLSGFMLFGFATFLLLHHRLDLRVRSGLIAIAVAFFVFSILARIYLLLHWPSDIAGSFLLGVVGMTIAIPIYLAFERQRLPQPRNPFIL